MIAYFSKKDLRNLYITKKLSTRQIATIYKCSKSTISSYLTNYSIPIRNHSEAKKLNPNPDKYCISKSNLRHLYSNKKLSGYQIANLFGCGSTAIFNKLKKYNIPRRNLSESISLTNSTRLPKIAKSNTKYLKTNFKGSLAEKAYLIGFRLGDLHVLKKPHGITNVVQCWSTKPEQISLLKNLFLPYGHITLNKRIKHGKEDIGFTCVLNTSFDFLIDNTDIIPIWILQNKKLFLSFAAGYIDAEGNFSVDRSWGRFSLSSYQKNIIHQIYMRFNQYGVTCPKPYISINAGYTDKRGITTRQNLWTLRVNRQASVLMMISLILPFMKHSKRIRDAKLVCIAAQKLAS